MASVTEPSCGHRDPIQSVCMTAIFLCVNWYVNSGGRIRTWPTQGVPQIDSANPELVSRDRASQRSYESRCLFCFVLIFLPLLNIVSRGIYEGGRSVCLTPSIRSAPDTLHDGHSTPFRAEREISRLPVQLPEQCQQIWSPASEVADQAGADPISPSMDLLWSTSVSIRYRI